MLVQNACKAKDLHDSNFVIVMDWTLCIYLSSFQTGCLHATKQKYDPASYLLRKQSYRSLIQIQAAFTAEPKKGQIFLSKKTH